MNYLSTAISDVGNEKSVNQDSYCIKIAKTKIGNVAFAIVCDGMGGLEKGELASSTVINDFNQWFSCQLPQLIEYGFEIELVKQQWLGLALQANDKIMKYSSEKGISMGSTVCAIFLWNDLYCILNVGDSRCYEISSDIVQLTKDQTIVQRKIDVGLISSDEAENDPDSSVLLQCIGCNKNIEPVVDIGKCKANAIYMICSDGFRHKISNEEMKNSLTPKKDDTEESLFEKINYLVELDKKKNETDNISVVVLKTLLGD